MMTSQPLFIPLYIDETEADLWLALQRIEPEKRSFFIKETLKQVLLGTDSGEVCSLPQDKVSADIREIQFDGNYPDGVAQVEEVLIDPVEQIETFSLDDLFSQTYVPHTDEEPIIVTEHEEEMLIPNRSPGFEYLMKHIIGTEDDEAVLSVLNQRVGTGSQTEGQKPRVR